MAVLRRGSAFRRDEIKKGRQQFVWVILDYLKENSAQVRQKGDAPSTFAFDRHCRCEGDAKAKAEGA